MKKFSELKIAFNKYARIIFSVVSVLLLVVSVLYTGIILAYNVEYNGKFIAIVKSKADYQKALNTVQNIVKCEKISDYASSPKFNVTLTVENKITDTDELVYNIINETDSIEKCDALFVNGEFVACTFEENGFSAYLDEYLLSKNSEYEEAVSEFVDSVSVEKGYYTVENTVDFESICEVLESLPVKTTVTLRTQNAIPYKSVTRKSADRFLGEVVKAVTGQDGIEETVENIVYIDGEEISRETLEATVVQKAVDEVTVIGTKARTVSASVSAQVSQLGLIWPLKRVDNQVISSWWGDDRNHQAIDIASPLGTPIYAAKGGTVTTATRRSDYGNYVVIDHGNGYQTVYAHASKLYVSVGETVMQGQVIAAVGSTGQSSGNHLHFEIRYNGTRIDPAPFLGLY